MVTSLMLFLSCPLGTGDGKDASPFFYLNDAKIQSISSEKSEVAEHSTLQETTPMAQPGVEASVQYYFLHPWC